MLYKKSVAELLKGLIYVTECGIITKMDEMCFVAVEFPDDVNVAGRTYWYLCRIEGAETGDKVDAPLGRHNRVQRGVVREVLFARRDNPPYPWYLIKDIVRLIKLSGAE